MSEQPEDTGLLPETSTPDFASLGLNRQLVNAIEDLGYSVPTPIQLQAIPQVLAGHDVLGIAQTGTGKTAAYLLPLLMKAKYAQGQHPRILILAPTRELAMQIGDHIGLLAKYTDLRYAVVYGGLGPKRQIEAVAAGLDIIVGTPGRVLELYLKGDLYLRGLQVMVLDEADRMMDMGFMPQIRRMLEVIPVKRQNLLFSATMPEKVVKLSEEFLEWPVRVEVAPQATTAETIHQVLYQVPNFATKSQLLLHLLQDRQAWYRVMVFARTRKNAEQIYKMLTEGRVEGEVKVIHANKGQNTRINAMEAFKDGDVRVLVATDVAARGIDVSMVSHVVNFDVPIVYEDYVHRIGRTGRAQQDGVAVTFVNEAEAYHINKIQKLIRTRIRFTPLPPDIVPQPTPFDEKQEMAKEVDRQKRKEDPTFKGAFHDTKKELERKANKGKKPSRSRRPSKRK